ncbi:MAG: ribose-5-phosphate isomerase RpiA [Pseudomonadota bacterium]
MVDTDAPLSPAEAGKRAAAARAVEMVEDGMTLGLGTGSTAKWFLVLLAESGKRVTSVPTSSQTEAHAIELGIPVSTLAETGQLDLTVDGADEFDGAMNLIKGGGGALLQEKIVAAASAKMVVISDSSKEVATLGAYDLPVEIVRFGWEATLAHISTCLGEQDVSGHGATLRGQDAPYVTDEGHFIVDLALGRIGDPASLNRDLNVIPGVVETGLFCDLADVVIVGHADGTARVIGG